MNGVKGRMEKQENTVALSRLHIVDFNINPDAKMDERFAKLLEGMANLVAVPISITLSNKKVETIDYIQIAPDTVLSIKSNKEEFNKVLDIVNKIYLEHIKLILLGCMYPIFNIIRDSNNKNNELRLKCVLKDFNKSGIPLGSYTVKSYISKIDIFSFYTCPLKELVIVDKIQVECFGSNHRIKVRGVENITDVHEYNIDCIVYNAEMYNNNEIRFKCLESIDLDITINNKIKRLVLEDTCKLTHLSKDNLLRFKGLNEIVFPSWANPRLPEHERFTIGNLALEEIITEKLGTQAIHIYREGGTSYIKVAFGGK